MHHTFKRCGQEVLFWYVEFTADIHPIFQILTDL